jgi:hypothetical protein
MRKILLMVVASLSLATCGGSSGSGGPQGLCQQIGTTACSKACSCREGPTCAMSQGGLELSFDTEADCLGFFVTLGCSMGDAAAYNDAAACLPLTQAAVCVGTGVDGAVELPADNACQSPP